MQDQDSLNGNITHENQMKAVNIKFLESQLEAIPQCLLQFCILWSREDYKWYQIICLLLSLLSVSKGSLDYVRITLSGNKKKPDFDELPKILPFFIHFLMVFLRKMFKRLCQSNIKSFFYDLILKFSFLNNFSSYSLLLTTFPPQYFCILLILHFFACIILAAIFTDDLFLFIYTSMAGLFSPILYLNREVFWSKNLNVFSMSI